MTLTQFSMPSDQEVLRKLDNRLQDVCFVGNGIISQKEFHTEYYRVVRIKVANEDILKRITYIKKGVSWHFKDIENLE